MNNFERAAVTKAYDHYDFGRYSLLILSARHQCSNPSVMHYGEFAFRNKYYGGLMAQLTRTIYPNLFTLGGLLVG